MNKRYPCSVRVDFLREYYLQDEPRIRKLIGDCRKHRALMLYLEGWKKYKEDPVAATTRLRKSYAEKYMLDHTVPNIFPKELIVGKPDLRDFTEAEAELFKNYKECEKFVVDNWGRKDHVALDYQLLLDKGVSGMIQLLEEKLSQIDYDNGLQAERYEFLLCSKIELEGLLQLCNAYADWALKMARNATEEDRESLLELYEVLKQVPANPARTFREALQSIQMFTFNLYGLYSYGKPDLYLWPYYKRDIENGTLTPDEAQELIDCFYLLSVSNTPGWAATGLMLGGRDAAGNPVENALTWHFLNAVEHTRIPDPNIGFCVTEETSTEILEYVAELIQKGYAQPQVWNNDAVVESMVQNGFDRKDANLFTLSTCVEVTPIGCSGINVTSPMINVLQVFLKSFAACNNNMSFEDVFETFQRHFTKVCREQVMLENLYFLEQGRNSTDPVRCSLLIHDCLERGLTHDSGGARYNQLEPDLFGVQNVGECLNVIKRIVFDEKRITIEEFQEALRCNYEGFENLLAYIRNKVPHFGAGDEETNQIVKRVCDLMLDTFKNKITARGDRILPGNFSYLYHVLEGKKTGASPDGRKAEMPLNDGCNPVQGYDNKGPTLSLASTAYWEPVRFLGGTSVNIKLNKGVAVDKIMALIKGYLKTKCAQIQFSVVSAEELLKAQENPEAYKNILVRIGGYSEFFVKLNKKQQDEVISRTLNEL